MKNSLKALLFCTFIFTSSAQAGFLIEPYLSYSFGSQDGSSTDTNFNGPGYGARLGYQFLGFMAGADYSIQSLNFDDDGDKKQLGLFAGYDAPILFRVWGTYFLNGSIEFDSNSELDGGSGYALGAGYTGLPFVSLNVEYRVMNYDEASAANVTNTVDIETKEILFSVSLPLNL